MIAKLKTRLMRSDPTGEGSAVHDTGDCWGTVTNC